MIEDNVEEFCFNHCKYCGWIFPENLIKKSTRKSKSITCEQCGTVNRFENYEFPKKKKKNRAVNTKIVENKVETPKIVKRYKQQKWIFLFRYIYEILKNPDYISYIKEDQKELTLNQVDNLASILRERIIYDELKEVWLNDLQNIRRIDFEEGYENFKNLLRKRKVYHENLRFFREAIEFIYELIIGKLKVSELKGFKLKIADDLKKCYGFASNLRQNKEFEIYLSMLISRYIYKILKSPDFTLRLGLGEIQDELTTSQVVKLVHDLRKSIAHRQIKLEWLDEFKKLHEKNFMKNYKKLQIILRSDLIYSESFLDFMKKLIKFIDGLIKGKESVSELKGIKSFIANYLIKRVPLQNNIGSNSIFKFNLSIILCRMIYLVVKVLESNRKLKENQNKTLDLNVDEILNILLSGIMDKKKIKSEFLEKLHKIKKNEFESEYIKLKSNLESDHIFLEQFSLDIRWLIKMILKLFSDIKPKSKPSKFESLIIRDLNNFNFEGLISFPAMNAVNTKTFLSNIPPKSNVFMLRRDNLEKICELIYKKLIIQNIPVRQIKPTQLLQEANVRNIKDREMEQIKNYIQIINLIKNHTPSLKRSVFVKKIMKDLNLKVHTARKYLRDILSYLYETVGFEIPDYSTQSRVINENFIKKIKKNLNIYNEKLNLSQDESNIVRSSSQKYFNYLLKYPIEIEKKIREKLEYLPAEDIFSAALLYFTLIENSLRNFSLLEFCRKIGKYDMHRKVSVVKNFIGTNFLIGKPTREKNKDTTKDNNEIMKIAQELENLLTPYFRRKYRLEINEAPPTTLNEVEFQKIRRKIKKNKDFTYRDVVKVGGLKIKSKVIIWENFDKYKAKDYLLKLINSGEICVTVQGVAPEYITLPRYFQEAMKRYNINYYEDVIPLINLKPWFTRWGDSLTIQTGADYLKRLFNDTINKKELCIVNNNAPTLSQLEKFGEGPFINAIRNRKISYNSMVQKAGYIPNETDLILEIGKMVHIIIKYILLSYVRELNNSVNGDLQKIKAYYEVRASTLPNRADNTLLRTESFIKYIEEKQNALLIPDGIKLINIDYYIGRQMDYLLDKTNRGYQGKEKYLLIILLNTAWNPSIKKLSNVKVINAGQFLSFIGFNGEFNKDYSKLVDYANNAYSDPCFTNMKRLSDWAERCDVKRKFGKNQRKLLEKDLKQLNWLYLLHDYVSPKKLDKKKQKLLF